MITSEVRYAAGNPVYNGGSPHATLGPVDPIGYIDRELNNPNSRTRLQDTRTYSGYTPGVASAAIERLRAATRARQDQMYGNRGGSTPVVTDPTGQVKFQIPLDYDLQTQMIDEYSKLNELLVRMQAQQQGYDIDKAIGERNLQEGQTDDYRKVLQNSSYRGMAFSSGYQQNRDKVSRQYTNAGADLLARYTSGTNNVVAQKNAANVRYQEILAAIQREAARRLAQKQISDFYAGGLA